MPNSDYQRHSFLGGEVSPSLYERADMEKFGKWFSKAENIRFRETGAFRNRPGFVKVADTKYNSSGEVIKLLSFAFNDEESFMVELGPSYARFYRNGAPIIVNDVPYEISTPLLGFSQNDLKYAQAGDTVFITHPTYGIYQLARLRADGTEWEFKKFAADILPMKEVNTNESSVLSLATNPQPLKYISIANPHSNIYLNVSFTFDGSVVYTAASADRNTLVSGITQAVTTNYKTFLTGDNFYIENRTALGAVPDFSITFQAVGLVDHSVSYHRDIGVNDRVVTGTVDTSSFYSLSNIYVRSRTSGYDVGQGDFDLFNGSKDISSATIEESSAAAIGFGAYDYLNLHTSYSEGIYRDGANLAYTLYKPQIASGTLWVTLSGYKQQTFSLSYSSQTETSTNRFYTMTATDLNFFDKLEAGDNVMVRHSCDAQEVHGDYEVGSYTTSAILGDGKWRFYTLGNWKGLVKIQYSEDNKQTWTDYFKWESQDTNDAPANITTSGTLVTDNLVWFRVVVNVTEKGNKPLYVFFTTDSYSVNSYYRIISKTNNYTAVVESIKNDIGEFSGQSQWRVPAFSNSEGWPQTVAFYQSRLFFGKDYIVYGSRSNDFWDFYEPVKLQADDPITMSLLSQKVNTIRNLVTQRSFFTFTAGGEFGIGSEGALTQNDKYLKPFSANGSAPCNPILISDKVLFVDKSYNSVRALQYTLESDGYEAPDLSITLRALLANEHIISTDTIFEEKEALFLSDTGTVWVLKYITDQNVLAWSHWKHAFGKITNICVVPRGAKHDLYIAVEANGRKWIEILNQEEYMDTVEYFSATSDSKVHVSGVPGLTKVILQEGKRYFRTTDANGDIDAPSDTTTGFKVGSVYTSEATLLPPIIQVSDYSHSNYELKAPYKVFYYYLNSYGFKVGVEDSEKMDSEWQQIGSDIDDETDLTSGKKSVLIPSRFDGSSRVSFVQQEPYPMEIADVLIQTDFGGK